MAADLSAKTAADAPLRRRPVYKRVVKVAANLASWCRAKTRLFVSRVSL